MATFQIFDLTGAIWHTNTRHFQVEVYEVNKQNSPFTY